MKTFIALLLALVMVLSLTACSGGSTGAAAQTEAAAPAETEAKDASFYEVTEPIEIVWWHSLEDQYSALIAESSTASTLLRIWLPLRPSTSVL